MLLQRVHIGHYRALRDCSIDLSDHTVFVGQNGAGKSTVLQAIRFFFDSSSNVSEDDQTYGSDEPLAVTVTLAELADHELESYADVLDGEHKLTVTKRCNPGEPAHYTVRGARYPGFDELRALNDESATAYRTAYKQFVEDHPEYPLTVPRSAPDCKAELIKWERQHPEGLSEADVDFSFERSTRLQLISTTRLIHVPAVHDAADDFRGGKTPLGQMIDALVTTQLEEKPAITELRERWDAEYQSVMEKTGASELQELSSRLSGVIGDFVPGASVTFSWEDEHPVVPIPAVRSQINEDGVPTDVSYQGHGMQRALIMALLQAYDEHARSRTQSESGTSSPTHILLLIEEPELYQHPPRARHISRVLMKLASEPRLNAHFRILSTTHSPNFVSVENLESIRIVRKEPASGIPIRRINALTLSLICEEYAKVTEKEPLTEAELRRTLHVLDQPLREAFFASSVVLTEGVGDVGVLAAECAHLGHDLEAKGIVVTSISGKGLIPIAIVILSLLGIQHYVVFDSDSDEQLRENQEILRLLNAAPDDIPSLGSPATAVRNNYAVLNQKMETVVSEEFGDAVVRKCVAKTAEIYNRKHGDVMKNPVTAAHVITLLHEQGKRSKTLEAIVSKLSELGIVGPK